jgi:predicted enzyme involved in methoxymalonyl-ACP biosynthesis
MSGADRFGDHGIVGVLALDRAERRVALVSISCRVLALGPATVFVSEVLRRSEAVDLSLPGTASTAAAPTVLARAHLALTARNGPCRSLFRDLGFNQVASTSADGNVVRTDSDSVAVVGQDWELHHAARLPRTDQEVYCVTFA